MLSPVITRGAFVFCFLLPHFWCLQLNNYLDDSNSSASYAGCTFSDEIQGVYRTQDFSFKPKVYDFGIRDALKYKDIFIGPTSIPYWGDCFERNGFSGELLIFRKVGGFMCYRCFTLIERTPNLLQGQTLNESICYRTIAEARRTCVDASLISPGEGIILWRAENIQYQHCPVGGRANLTYTSGNRLHCPYPVAHPSTISNCQLGYQLDISFRSCTFPAYEMSLRCLGTWDAGKGDGETYFALYNTVAEEYRCGIFKDDRDQAGYAMAALSNDSTCTNILFNNTNGYEVFAFFSEAQSSDWPNYQAQCVFPDWLQTDWQIMNVGKDLISYYQNNDPDSMTTLYGKCVSVDGDYIKIYTKTHCGDTLGYHCLRFKRRSPTVVELQLGLTESKHQNLIGDCNREAIYANSTWTSLTTRNVIDGFEPCTRYLGLYASSMSTLMKGRHCFNITADCHDSSRISYTSYICGTDNVYENHQYRCLANWEEDNYHYTYVVQEDTQERGCFISKHATKGRQMYTTYRRRNCERNVKFEPLIKSDIDYDRPVMVLDKKHSCSKSSESNDIDDFQPKSDAYAIQRRMQVAFTIVLPLLFIQLLIE